MGRKTNIGKNVIKFLIIAACITGFLVQTVEFLELYWTFPTVVDIQVSVPFEIDVPAISFCNSNGFHPSVICSLGDFCLDSEQLNSSNYCGMFPLFCNMFGATENDFQAVLYKKYFTSQNINATIVNKLRKPVKSFFKCQIRSSGVVRECEYENIIVGPYYSDTEIFHLCYTFNSLFSQPDKKLLKIKKSERINLEFFVDILDRNESSTKPPLPKYNYPRSPSIQLSVHSPYKARSPFSSGMNFMAGKQYQIKLKQEEKHLLPPPYQTNCTNYISSWTARGGLGPVNQRMVIEECKYNISLKELGCVPFEVDYPHNKTLCRYCENCKDISHIADHCMKLQQIYNQPCDFISYEMESEEKLISIESIFTSSFMKMTESFSEKRKGYNCTFEKIWTRKCQTVNIEMVFDDFEITNLTYNPKFENLELFSVIGGYMGMYLGVSIVAVYDFAETIIIMLYNLYKKHAKKKKPMEISKKTQTWKRKQNSRFKSESEEKFLFNLYRNVS